MFTDRIGAVADAPEGEGAELLEQLHQALTRYVVFPSPEAVDAVTLWVAATHGQPAWEHAPRLPLVSPVKRCGKSRLLDVIEATCNAPLITVNASVAAVCRSISNDPPTLLVDEADTLFGSKKVAENNEDVRGILNAGHQRNRPYIRWDITTRTAEKYPTFAMACLASIGDLPDTIMDRSVVIRMRRRAPGEKVAPYRTRRDAPPLNELRDALHAWVRDHLDELEKAVPKMPLEDREGDTWEPLVAVADLAGGSWPSRARAAAETLTGAERTQEEETQAVGVQLLADLRDVFGTADALATRTILDRLHEIEESPWADWNKGKGLNARGLAGLLRAYGAKSKVVRIGEATPRGYERAALDDAWTRYLSATSATAQQTSEAAAQGRCTSVADDEPAIRNTPELQQQPDVADVADVAAPPSTNGQNAWVCAGCGHRVTAFVDMTNLPHPKCGGRFQADGAR
jgi:Protein of unknown function (DUF3631)